MIPHYPIEKLTYYLTISLLLGLISLLTRKISIPGALTGTLILFVLMCAFDDLGLCAISVFFATGTVASHWKKREKGRMGLAEANEGKRRHTNVLANAGMAFLLAICAIALPALQNLFAVAMAATFASALSDTMSSEIGNIYGRSFVNIQTLKKGVRGQDGMISLEGTLSGLLGATLMGTVYLFFEFNVQHCVVIVVAGMIGNLSDSLLGASLQQRGFLNNHMVNFLNTLIAALIALGLLVV